MPLPEWTGILVGEMHMHQITSKDLAKEVGWHEKYLSLVLNGHRAPKDAEAKLKGALSNLINRKEQV